MPTIIRKSILHPETEMRVENKDQGDSVTIPTYLMDVLNIMLAAGYTVAAIKFVRAFARDRNDTNLSLRTAKDFVDAIVDHRRNGARGFVVQDDIYLAR